MYTILHMCKVYSMQAGIAVINCICKPYAYIMWCIDVCMRVLYVSVWLCVCVCVCVWIMLFRLEVRRGPAAVWTSEWPAGYEDLQVQAGSLLGSGACRQQSTKLNAPRALPWGEGWRKSHRGPWPWGEGSWAPPRGTELSSIRHRLTRRPGGKSIHK